MAVIAFRQNALSQANRSQAKVLRWATRIALGADGGTLNERGAIYEQADGTRWRIFSDLRISLLDVVHLGTVCARLAQVPEDWVDGLTRAEARDKVITYVQNHRVIPDMNAMPEGYDPFRYAAEQQTNAVNWFSARLTVPSALTPVDEAA